LSTEKGYRYGIEPGKELFREGVKSGVSEISVYAFTEENTRRPKEQIAAFKEACVEFVGWMRSRDVSLLVVGNSDSPSFPDELRDLTAPRSCCEGRIKVNFLVNYSWRWDLGCAARNGKLGQGVLAGIGSSGVSPIDLIIRWGGRRRLSGFLPIQSAYADIFVLDDLWPDFKIAHFHEALRWYAEQDVTRGG